MSRQSQAQSQLQHPDWEKENSLTAPADRDRENRWRPDPEKVLTENEVTAAVEELYDTSFIEKFPRLDRLFRDPPPPGQKFSLISFTPAKGATPNENGVYGFIKTRGNYNTVEEASQRAEFLIRYVDSFHQIKTGYCGYPLPLTLDSRYSAEVDEIDIRKQTVESTSAYIKSKKMEDKKEMEEMKNREADLLAESRRAQLGEEVDDPYETYITLKVKKAQLTWTYLEHTKKMEEIKNILVKTRKELEELDSEHPTFSESYFDKYKKAREQAGFQMDDMQDNFIKFMVEDVTIPEVEALYEEKYGSTPTYDSDDNNESKEDEP